MSPKARPTLLIRKNCRTVAPPYPNPSPEPVQCTPGSRPPEGDVRVGRFLGIDVGAESIRVAELRAEGAHARLERCVRLDHAKAPAPALAELLANLDWTGISAAAVTGRLGQGFDLPHIPTRQALAVGFRFLHDRHPVSIVSIGSRGFSVLELRAQDVESYRESSRCSQGTGNFLRQLTERFGLDVDAASRLAGDVEDAAPLSGRCPVILKSDMTHLANKGTDRARILAGLFDALCENVRPLIKPRSGPRRLLLTGGVSRAARVRAFFTRYAQANGLELLDSDDHSAEYLEAIGAALEAMRAPAPLPPLERLARAPEEHELDTLPALGDSLRRVRRMSAEPAASGPAHQGLVLGLDIGSTGSKLVAVGGEPPAPFWEGYRNTSGDPVGAAQALVREFAQANPEHAEIKGIGVTGSGRDIVGSMLASCYGEARVSIQNEIVAHARGAVHYDPRVDTIFEIGGQDAKYIRLAGGRVIDAAMNEACSAGTGSFIAEQGAKLAGVRDVQDLSRQAMAATSGVSLGQHCSVFMAEIIDEAIGAGVEQGSIISGIYDSVIQNYLNRVKGNREVGEVIFCQGMPFASDALAAAVARQTGGTVIVPPNPGTVGALGIALLAAERAGACAADPLELRHFLRARVSERDSFVCKSDKGCGSGGNRCRVDRLKTVVEGATRRFTWGGACSLWDRGTRGVKLPDRAPDPAREREALAARVRTAVRRPGAPRLAMSEEFALKGMMPFFATYLHGLGFDVEVAAGAGREALKRGIEEADVPYCAPMQLYSGVVSQLAAGQPNVLFLPMMRSLARREGERHAASCPIVQASSDILAVKLAGTFGGKLCAPIIDVGPAGLEGAGLRETLAGIARELGVESAPAIERARRRAIRAQRLFDRAAQRIGRRALSYCARHALTPIVILGRPYTIYNGVLNSNLPAILREQGAVAVPIDCYPIAAETPGFASMFWYHGQRNLRAAAQIAATPNVYSIWASNYSCGPDSFNLHLYAHLMRGKPFTVIETDGHSGDAGTKTRVEAFLHCVREHHQAGSPSSEPSRPPASIDVDTLPFDEIRRRGDTILVPHLGPGSAALAACLRGLGVKAEALPEPTRDSLRLGRRQTSGKECLPLGLTLGSLLERLERDRTDQGYAFLMPRADGPCRFGVYHLLHGILLERLGWGGRVRIWSPNSDDYFEGVPAGFSALVFIAFAASDVLLESLYHCRPIEAVPGEAERIYRRYRERLLGLLEATARDGRLSLARASLEIASGKLYGLARLLREAGRDFAAACAPRALPTVLVAGEIYVRCVPFANQNLVRELERRGLRVRFAPFNEWLEYADHMARANGTVSGFGARLTHWLRRRVLTAAYRAVGRALGWPPRPGVGEIVAAARGYVRDALQCESVLSVGAALLEWEHGHIDGAVNVGPLECMPGKIADAQLRQAAESSGLLTLSLSVNGDPLGQDELDAFAFAVHTRRRDGSHTDPAPAAVPAALPEGLTFAPDTLRPGRAPGPACAHPACAHHLAMAPES